MVKQNTTIIYENTVAGTFVRRMNRFTAEVLIDGAPEIVHVKNTGRLQELLMPEAKVTLQKTLNPNRKTAYDLILSETDASCVNFELDSYWPTEAGVNALELMRKLDTRMKLYHINDRGTRLSKPAMTPILKSDSMELGYGNMNLFSLITQAQKVNVDAVILESHKKLGGRFSIKVHGVKCRIYESVRLLEHSWKGENAGNGKTEMHFITSDREYARERSLYMNRNLP